MNTNSAAYQAGEQMGEILGAVLVIALTVGILVFFIIALIRAIKTGRTGWVVAACISGLPVLAFIGLIFIGVVEGILQAGHQSSLLPAAPVTTADLLTASTTVVPGTTIPYEISYPSFGDWKKVDSSNAAFDQLYTIQDTYVGVIAEKIGVGNPQRICDIAQKNLADKASQYQVTAARPVQIDSHSWLTYDATATVSGFHLKYRFYVYSDDNVTFQVFYWTSPAQFDSTVPVFDRVAQSFKLPKS